MTFIIGFIFGTGALWAFGYDPLFSIVAGVVTGVLGMWLCVTLDNVNEYFEDKHDFYRRNK